MFETKSGVFLIAGVGFFLLAFLSNAVVPALMYAKFPEKTVEELIEDQEKMLLAPKAKRSITILTIFKKLRDEYPEQFKKYIGEPTKENLAMTLRHGRKIYIGEGCWHCHSQFVRPVSNEERRWGPVSQ
ncbi:MAG: cbb3-type cytochrome c oxidase subunit II, partial [Gemmataceae bacterium]|nr:cbb3-type cytochrome c oxidase subunit II [Gemmataceae bacterium]